MTTLTQPRSKAGIDVVVVGDINVDLIACFARFPGFEEDALASSSELHCGGSAANASMALARLGIRVRLVSRVGRDSLATTALRRLRQAGVELDSVQRDPSVMTGLIYIIVTPGGERTMLSDRGANAHTDPAEIDEERIRAARHLHLSGYALLAEPQRGAALRAWDIARRGGLSLSLDPGLAPAERHVLDGLLPTTNLLLPTLGEAQALTGETTPEACARALLALQAQIVALKLGGDGCLLAGTDGVVRVPAFPVEARDSTGAGDWFDAGVLMGFLGGLDGHSAAVLGNALGALAAAQMGADTAALSARSVARFLECQMHQPAFAEHAAAIGRALQFSEELHRGTTRLRRPMLRLAQEMTTPQKELRS